LGAPKPSTGKSLELRSLVRRQSNLMLLHSFSLQNCP
jgi:hypothetical protein